MGEGPNDSPAPSGRKESGRGVRASGLRCPLAGRQPRKPGPSPPFPPPPPPATRTAHGRA